MVLVNERYELASNKTGGSSTPINSYLMLPVQWEVGLPIAVLVARSICKGTPLLESQVTAWLNWSRICLTKLTKSNVFSETIKHFHNTK